jgi:hypothetical protein
MTSRLIAPLLLMLGALSTTSARAATVAVMPVRGANLTEGQCDAMGVMFATAFAHDARVVVASPVEVRPVRVQAASAQAAAAQMGVKLYVELTAVRLGKRVTLSGVLHQSDGLEVFRAEATGASLDAMDTAISALAHALAWRRPIGTQVHLKVDLDDDEPSLQGGAPATNAEPAWNDPLHHSTFLGMKGGFALPIGSGRSYSPVLEMAFDGRVGPRDHFVQFGAGAFLPTQDAYTSTSIRVSGAYFQLGGGVYFGSGSAALYAAGALAPTLWSSEVGSESHTALTCALSGQLGATLTRNSRTRLSMEVRLSQYMLGVADPASYGGGDFVVSGTTSNYYPRSLAFLFGAGW